jgi:mannose-6-phosphate isomerase-like protein (cupin superfamily)
MVFVNTLHITKSSQGKYFLVAGDVTIVRASSEDTAGQMLMLEVSVEAGGGPPVLHRHQYSEIFYFLEGEFEISTADDDYKLSTHRVKAGDAVAVPSLVWHNFKNVGTTSGKFIVIHSPPVMEAFLQEVGVPIDDPLNPPKPAGPPSPEAMQQLMQTLSKYMEVLPPEKVSSKPQEKK